MDADDGGRAFERFWRGNPARSGPGSGLGLSIVTGIVAAHRGNVELTTAPGRGTTVRVTLPASLDFASPVRESSPRRDNAEVVAKTQSDAEPNLSEKTGPLAKIVLPVFETKRVQGGCSWDVQQTSTTQADNCGRKSSSLPAGWTDCAKLVASRFRGDSDSIDRNGTVRRLTTPGRVESTAAGS